MCSNITREEGMPIKSEKDSMKDGKYSVLILPKEDASEKSLEIFPLEGPNNRNLLLMKTEDGNLRELKAYSDAHRSWFVGEVVENDGRLWMATEFDPIFLVLPYLKEGKKVPLDHLIPDSRITECPLLKTRMSLVADPIGDEDLNVWKFNSNKTLEYLSKKVKAIANVLSKNSIHIDSTSAEGFSKSSSTDGLTEKRTLYAWGILSDYISKDLSTQLQTHMNIANPEESSSNNKKRQSSSGDSGKDAKRRKSTPDEDYLISTKEATPTRPLNQKQKALAKSASGSKNIASFFSRK